MFRVLEPSQWRPDAVAEHIQVNCPDDGRQRIVELGPRDQEGPTVAWCSRDLDRPDCDQECLRSLGQVSYIMVSDVPRFQLAELPLLSVDDVVEQFQDITAERLPVLDGDRFVGSLSLRKLALWSDSREAMKSLSMGEDQEGPTGVQSCYEEGGAVVGSSETWQVAVARLLEQHSNEIFVLDDEGRFVGMLYARQLLRIAAS